MIEVKLQAQLTLEEFQAICGPDRSIVSQLSLETSDEQDYGIKLHIADALEDDYGLDSIQTRAIAALRPEGEWRAREAGDIPPRRHVPVDHPGNGLRERPEPRLRHHQGKDEQPRHHHRRPGRERKPAAGAMLMDIPLEEKHLDAMNGENPATAALREAEFPNPRIAATRITTSETVQWTIAGLLADWLERQRRGEPVRVGALRLDPVTAGISISEAPQSWSRVTEFHQAPSHYIKFQVEIFCEDGAVTGMAQHGLDFDEERPRLANGEHIVLEFRGLPPVTRQAR